MINRSLFLYGMFEISETRLLQSLLGPGMTFADVGANIGYYTVLGARLVGPGGLVHSFEPNHPVRARLQANVRRNGFTNVVVHAEALAGHTGEVTFYASTTASNQGISSILPGVGRADRQQVASLTLDDFVATLGSRRIDVMKLDIEGAEREVFGSGRHLLESRDAPVLIFEAAQLEPVADVLRDCGYRMRRIHYTLGHGLELRDPAEEFDDLFAAYEAPNYFAAKSDDIFGHVLKRANVTRPAALRLIGRL
jgi:FkbM family methyltransferase